LPWVDPFLVGKPRRTGAAKKRAEPYDAFPTRRAKDAVREGVAAGRTRGRKENVSDEVEIHAII
jgi:hypothetical protein